MFEKKPSLRAPTKKNSVKLGKKKPSNPPSQSYQNTNKKKLGKNPVKKRSLIGLSEKNIDEKDGETL